MSWSWVAYELISSCLLIDLQSSSTGSYLYYNYYTTYISITRKKPILESIQCTWHFLFPQPNIATEIRQCYVICANSNTIFFQCMLTWHIEGVINHSQTIQLAYSKKEMHKFPKKFGP